MATSFKRNRTQEYIESEIDPTYDPLDDDGSKRKAFQQKSELFMFSTCQKIIIRSYLEQDAYDYLFSAFVSFFNGIQNICENNYSWSTVELYYTMFYQLTQLLFCPSSITCVNSMDASYIPIAKALT